MLLANFLTSFLLFDSTTSKLFYDPNSCACYKFSRGFRPICSNSLASCQTFIVQGFEKGAEISRLFGVEQDVLHANNLPSQIIKKDWEESGDAKMTSERWISLEYVHHGSVSDEADVFAFGVVLLELLSAKEARDGTFVKEMGNLTAGGSSSGCSEELRGLMDPSLKDYPSGSFVHGYSSQSLPSG